MYDFIVVGAGIAGASIAYELAESARVVLLEREERAGVHATGRSAALFAPSYGGVEVRALTAASAPFLHAPPPEFTDADLLRPRGCLFIARPEQVERLQNLVASVRSSGGALQPETPARALERVPNLRKSAVAMAAHDAHAMDMDVDALHQAYLRGARRRGADLRFGVDASRIARSGGDWRLDEADPITAPVLILAAGAWADDVAARVGARRLGLQAMRRTVALVDPPACRDFAAWPFVIDADETFYFKEESGKLLISPADETPMAPGDVQADELDVAIAVDRVQQVLDLEVRRVTHRWAGLRTFAPDRVPVVGHDPIAPGLFWCAGQGGYGIQTAPAMARLTAALACGEPPPADLIDKGLDVAALHPERFLTSAAGR